MIVGETSVLVDIDAQPVVQAANGVDQLVTLGLSDAGLRLR